MDEIRRQELFVRLLTQYERNLRRYVTSLLPDRSGVDDVLQETSVALWKKFDDYRPDEPFIPWACRFAYFEVLKHRKNSRNQRLRFSDEVVEALAQERLAHQGLLDAQATALEGCLAKLPPSDRELIEKRYGGESSVADFARDAGLPAKPLYRAMERIRRGLLECVNRRLALEGWTA